MRRALLAEARLDKALKILEEAKAFKSPDGFYQAVMDTIEVLKENAVSRKARPQPESDR